MELDQVIKTRRSIRKYTNKEVDENSIEEIVRAAILAPSWKNSQTARYHVITSKEMLKTFKDECLPEFNRENCKDAPVLIVCSFINNRSGYERDGTPSNELKNGWGCYDLGLHNQNLLLKATELGLGTLVMGIRDANRIQEVLKMNASETVVSVIALGYPAMEPEMPKRKQVEDIITYY